MTKDEALQMCLEYIETDAHERKYVRHAIKEALAQPKQEPVAWVCMNNKKHDIDFDQPEIDAIPVGTMLYTHPQRTWVGLTDEEKNSFWKADQMTQKEWDELFADIEAKLKEKNK